MFVRNLLQAGDYAIAVPAGIRITLQYDSKGSIEAVYVGHPGDQVLHPELLNPIIAADEVPVHIPTTKGTSYVYGCLYTDDIYDIEGELLGVVESNYIRHYLEDPSRFHFFAGYIQNYAVGTNTVLPIQRWLKTMNFDVLPGHLIPPNPTEEKFQTILNLDTYPFKYPRIMSFIVHRNSKFQFVPTKLSQVVVKSIEKYTTYEGYIFANITSNNQNVFTVSYAEVVNFNIHEGSVLLVDSDNCIIDCNDVSNKNNSYKHQISCEYCGRLITVPKTNVNFTCEDSHCVSVLYTRVNHMLSKFGLEKTTFERLKEFAKKTNNKLCLSDVLDMEEYSNSHVSIDIANLLHAIVPSNILPRFSDWTVFCNKCNNSIDTIMYYLKNSDKMMLDLHLDTHVYRRFYTWIQDPENFFDISGIVEHPNVTVISSGKKFEGAPIFRNKSIYITGACIHGSFDDMKSILTSYSAEVCDAFNTAVDCVIVGGLHEGVSGKAIQRAKMMGIPIFEETEFFNKYDIDTDIALYI